MKTFVAQHKFTLTFLFIILVMAFIEPSYAKSSLNISFDNLVTMMGVIPPIFLLIGLMDVWIPKETMIKYMGEHSGMTGLFFSFLLGSMAAGPLYAAFPIAALLLRKGARFAYVFFFLGTWTSAKLPLVLFEMTSLGVLFTLIHITSMMLMYLIGSFYLESLLKPHEKTAILDKIHAMSQ
ncbi:MAG: permease [Firmicutes bacterium HGW-Firmicutes-3]|jgi:uncharacterized membrane protein YraQ (UPF0718 family)|nr:MAG: permease [Firmicutes bacterium HGW-Firmicutes-3]